LSQVELAANLLCISTQMGSSSARSVRDCQPKTIFPALIL
jgi:hypothetical protein